MPAVTHDKFDAVLFDLDGASTPQKNADLMGIIQKKAPGFCQ